MPKKQSPIDDMSKAMLRLELQQKIIQLKYSGYQAVPSSSVPIGFFCLFVCFLFFFWGGVFLGINRNMIEYFCIC